MTAQNHTPLATDRNLDNLSDRVSVRDDGYLSEDPTTFLRPGDSLIAGGVDWAWCHVWFKRVVGFPEYIVGSNGTIWSGLMGRRRKSAVTRRVPRHCSSGHRQIRLTKDGQHYEKQVHRLVLEAFFGPCPDGMECLHSPDPDPNNNVSRNLRWGTRLENVTESKLQGKTNRGTKSPLSKLVDSDIPLIYYMRNRGIYLAEIARRFGVKTTPIQRIVSGLGWAHIKVTEPFSVLPAYRDLVATLPAGRHESLLGQRFSRLTVIGQTKVTRNDGSRRVWVCSCDCGGTKLVDTRDLKSARTKDCGCIKQGATRT